MPSGFVFVEMVSYDVHTAFKYEVPTRTSRMKSEIRDVPVRTRNPVKLPGERTVRTYRYYGSGPKESINPPCVPGTCCTGTFLVQ
jgi:hypothetical protein